MTRVLQLTDPRAQDVGLVGGPMATLARLAAAGEPVPPGFVVTTECGPWEDAEAEAAVYRAYHALGDGRGGLPTVCTIASPLAQDGAAHPNRASTLDELLTAIDACRGDSAITAVGVLQVETVDEATKLGALHVPS